MSVNINSEYNNLNRSSMINNLYNSARYSLPLKDTKKTIILEKTSTYQLFPTLVEFFKKDNYISKTPDKNSYKIIYKDNNILNFYSNREKHLRDRNQIHSSDSINMDSFRNSYRKIYNLRNFKYSFGSPLLTDNILRINKIISISPKTDFRKYNKKNEIEVEIGEDNFTSEKHKMRYLLSRNYKNHKKNGGKKTYKKNQTNNINIISKSNYDKILDNENFNKSIPPNILNKSINEKYMNRYMENNISNRTDINFIPLNNRNRNIYNFSPMNEEDIRINTLNSINNNSFNICYDNIKIRIDDIVYLEKIFDAIIYNLNNYKNISDINTVNECFEFFDFYFNSSLKDKFPYFFGDQNYIIIHTAFNLILFMLIIVFHLSKNPTILFKTILKVRNIFDKLKLNLYLFIKRIQLYYGDAFCCKNERFFNKFNNFLILNGLFNINEIEIVDIICRNSVYSCNQLGDLLDYYRIVYNEYYSDFLNLFLSLSKIDEVEIKDYFYNNILNIKEDMNNNINYDFGENNCNIQNQNIVENYIEEDIVEDDQYLKDVILDYKLHKATPPFVKPKVTKRYTIVLDLGGTLLNLKIDQNGNTLYLWRPGIISFLEGIKPYYEIIAFSKLSKEYSELIIQQIDKYRILFDYNLSREHCVLVNNKFVKDISRIGRDIRKMIMVDDTPENLEYHIDNGILIFPYNIESDNEDRVLYELKKLLLLFYNMGYEDLRLALKQYKNEIYNRITMGNLYL